jgi:hypothetical protein
MLAVEAVNEHFLLFSLADASYTVHKFILYLRFDLFEIDNPYLSQKYKKIDNKLDFFFLCNIVYFVDE